MAYLIKGKDGVAIKDEATNEEIKGADFEIDGEVIQKSEGGRRTIDVPVSSDRQDRDGDRINQAGIDPTHAKSVLYAHDWGHAGTMPIAKIVGRKIEEKDGYALTIETHEFPAEGKYILSDTAWNLIEFGALRSTSIGFIPKKITQATSDDERIAMGLGVYGVMFDAIEQLETSWVPVQSNREAITEAFKKGLIPKDILAEMFPQSWLTEHEPPKHWFVGEDLTVEETPDNLTQIMNSLAGIAKRLDAIEAGPRVEPPEAEEIDEVISAALDVNTTQESKGADALLNEAIITALIDTFDKKIISAVSDTTSSQINKALGKIDPTGLTFRKRA